MTLRTAPLAATAFTDYPDLVVRQVELLKYDNNKYATVRMPDGREEAIKRGYIWRDAGMTRRFNERDWHLLGGGTRRSFKQRRRKTTYRVWVAPELATQLSERQRDFLTKTRLDTQTQALRLALSLARKLGSDVEFSRNVDAHNGSRFGSRFVACQPDGDAAVYDADTPRRCVKFLRGHGKHSSAWR